MADAVAFPKLIFKGRGSSVLGTGSSAQLIMCGPRVCGQEFPFLRHILEDGARGVRWRCSPGWDCQGAEVVYPTNWACAEQIATKDSWLWRRISERAEFGSKCFSEAVVPAAVIGLCFNHRVKSAACVKQILLCPLVFNSNDCAKPMTG